MTHLAGASAARTQSAQKIGEHLDRRAATETDVPFLLELRRQTMSAHQLAAGLVPSDGERTTRVLVRYERLGFTVLEADEHATTMLFRPHHE